MKSRLAIVIPAYKSDFLAHALRSVMNQTCKDFRLYVGDDTGVGQLKKYTEELSGEVDLVYRAFNENLGLKDLASQWERCIDMTEDEEFIWLFSDDDIMPVDAVERFYKATEDEKKFDLYRFNIVQVNKEGKYISELTRHPAVELVNDYLYRRLKGETLSAACEYIFTRNVFKTNGGFVHFPLAWCSDDASWYLFGKTSGIKTIEGDPISWRISDMNISGNEKYKKDKYKATILFYKWIRNLNPPDQVLNALYFSIKRQIKILNISFFEYLGMIPLLKDLVSIEEAFKLSVNILGRNIYFRNGR